MKAININGVIQEYQKFTSFVESLRTLSEENWTTPIAKHKWSVRDIIGHIMYWDKYILNEAIIKINKNQDVTVQQDLNIDEFNQKAVEYIKTKDRDEIINQTIQYRQELVKNLMLFSEEQFFKTYIDSSGIDFIVKNYLEEFILHDEHHKRQIEEFLHSKW